MRLKTAAGLALVLAGCAETTVPMAPSQADAAGRAFASPPPGSGALYVYRADRPQPVVWGISAGRLQLGDLAPKTWLRADLPAGSYDLRCTGGQFNSPALELSLAV